MHTLKIVLLLLSLFTATLWNTVDQITSKRWSHTLSNGVSFESRMDLVGLSGMDNAEILYKGECNLRLAVQAWSASEDHKQYLEDQEYKYMVAIMTPFKDTDGIDKCFLVVNYSKGLSL